MLNRVALNPQLPVVHSMFKELVCMGTFLKEALAGLVQKLKKKKNRDPNQQSCDRIR